MPRKKIDLIGPRLRELAKKHATERQQRNKVPGNSAWERLKWVVENEWLAPISRVGANVNPFSKKSERGKASIADLFQATAMGIGTGWPAAGRGASTVGILKKDILRKIEEGAKGTSPVTRIVYENIVLNDDKVMGDIKHVLNLFKDDYLDVSKEKGLKLRDFSISLPREMRDRMGVYNNLSNAIKIKMPMAKAHAKELPEIIGHEMAHWWNDHIRDQLMRRLIGKETKLSNSQIEETRKIFSDFASDVRADTDVAFDIRRQVTRHIGTTKKQIDTTLNTDAGLALMGDIYKAPGASSEHASMAWEQLFHPGKYSWGDLPYSNMKYIATKSFARAAKNLQEMGWHKEISDNLIEAAKRQWQGQDVDMAPFGRWYGRQTMDEKARLAERFKRLIKEK